MSLNDVRNEINTAENYVLYRLPNEKRGHLISSQHIHAHETIPTDFSSLKNAFVFAPFTTGKHPFLAISSEKPFIFDIEDQPTASSHYAVDGTSPSEAYQEAYNRFVSAVREKRFQKLVLSRSQTIQIEKQDPLQLFCRVCHTYPTAMVSLFHSSQSGNWLGASPELLLSGDDTQLRTIALAGTLRNRDTTPLTMADWGEKERLEQRIVADFIRDRIACFGTPKDEWGPYSVSAGHLSHLRTDFYLTMDEERRAPFLSAIHPTPAVCGLPQEKALQFISENEGLDRSYYAGFLGHIDGESKMDLYVNLRCMRFTDSEATLYAGGGILATSDLQSEWNETEEKMNTLKRILF